MYPRTLSKKIEQSLKLYPVAIITGAKQVGKSTEAYRLAKTHGFNYVSLDDIEKRHEAISDLQFFILSSSN